MQRKYISPPDWIERLNTKHMPQFLMNADFEFDNQHKLRPNSRRNEKIRIWIAAAFL